MCVWEHQIEQECEKISGDEYTNRVVALHDMLLHQVSSAPPSCLTALASLSSSDKGHMLKRAAAHPATHKALTPALNFTFSKVRCTAMGGKMHKFQMLSSLKIRTKMRYMKYLLNDCDI